ncbi:MAG: hypothetical protein ACYC9M_07780 [Desulfobulbaceae bacterium]
MNIDQRYAKQYDRYLSIFTRAGKEVKGAGKHELSFDTGLRLTISIQPEIMTARLPDPVDGYFQRKREAVPDNRFEFSGNTIGKQMRHPELGISKR